MEEWDWREVEDADYMVDMKTSIGKRKSMSGRGGEAGYIPKSDRYDEDYVLFLEGLEEFWESKFKGDEEEDDDDEDDPSYIAFFNSLKVHGNAYMCCVSMDYGVFSPIVYEEDCDSIPVKRKLRKSHGVTWSKEVVDNSNVRSRHSDGVQGKKTTISHEGTCFVSEGKKVEENLRREKKRARNQHINVGQGKTTFSSRRGECNESVHVKGDQRSGSVYSSFGKKVSAEVNDTYKEFLDNLYVEAGSMIFKYGDRKKIVYECNDDENEPLEKDVKPSASDLREVSRKSAPLTSCLRPSKTVSSSPSSILEPSTSLPRPKTPPSREKACKTKKEDKRFASYWKELHDYLRKPYMQEEYDQLMKIATERTPMLIHRESRRGGNKKHGELGRSLLQCYPDVNAEIKKVQQDCYKVLNLLRMFTFYLKKIPSRPPKPWEDGDTKRIMPGSRS